MRLSHIREDFDEYEGLDDEDKFGDDPYVISLDEATSILSTVEVALHNLFDVTQIPIGYGGGIIGPYMLEVENPNGENVIIAVTLNGMVESRIDVAGGTHSRVVSLDAMPHGENRQLINVVKELMYSASQVKEF